MKKTRALTALAGALALTAALTATAFAASPVTASLRPDIAVNIDGAVQTFYNAQGAQVHPILYNGTTYLPIRAIGELMGKNVNWDAATGTATLGGARTTGRVTGTPDTGAQRAEITLTLCPEYHIVIDGVERTFADVKGNAVAPAVYNGSIYLPIRAIGELMSKTVTWDGESSTVRLTGGADALVTDFDTSTATAPTAPMAAAVTLEQAKQTALTHAGLSAAQVTFLKAEQDLERGRLVYEVEFITLSGGTVTEYDYEIDAATGQVVSYDYDIEGYVPAAGGSAVSAATAKQTALSRVPGATEAQLVEWEYDYDDGRGEYEGKILYGGMEYEFTIDAATGSVTEWEVERVGR